MGAQVAPPRTLRPLKPGSSIVPLLAAKDDTVKGCVGMAKRDCSDEHTDLFFWIW